MSRRGLCEQHTDERIIYSAAEMHLRTGPTFLKYRRNVAASVGGVLIQDLPPEARALL